MEEKLKEVHIGIEGMRCPMCESHIDDVLRKVPGVRSSKANRHKKEAVVVALESVDPETMKNAIAKEGYGVTSYLEGSKEKKGFFGRLFSR